MKNLRLSKSQLVSSMVFLYVLSPLIINAQDFPKSDISKAQIILSVVSENPSLPALFDISLTQNGKTIKLGQNKTPYKKVFKSGDMVFHLKKLKGKSRMIYSVKRFDDHNRQIGGTKSITDNVVINVTEETIGMTPMK